MVNEKGFYGSVILENIKDFQCSFAYYSPKKFCRRRQYLTLFNSGIPKLFLIWNTLYVKHLIYSLAYGVHLGICCACQTQETDRGLWFVGYY